MNDIETIVGLTMTKVEHVTGDDGDECILLESACGRTFKLYHSQNCCESVEVNDICGDLSDIVGMPILLAEEVSSSTDDDEDPPPPPDAEYKPESYTWTFYKLATNRGSVTIRWLGESNGYYSESVDFVEVKR